MIRMLILEEAREEANRFAATALTIHIYRMPDGSYWLDQLPPRLIKLEFVETVSGFEARLVMLTAKLVAATSGG